MMPMGRWAALCVGYWFTKAYGVVYRLAFEQYHRQSTGTKAYRLRGGKQDCHVFSVAISGIDVGEAA